MPSEFFCCLLLRSGRDFFLKGLHPFLDIYLHTVVVDPSRSLFSRCFLIFCHMNLSSRYILAYKGGGGGCTSVSEPNVPLAGVAFLRLY